MICILKSCLCLFGLNWFNLFCLSAPNSNRTYFFVNFLLSMQWNLSRQVTFGIFPYDKGHSVIPMKDILFMPYTRLLEARNLIKTYRLGKVKYLSELVCLFILHHLKLQTKKTLLLVKPYLNILFYLTTNYISIL